MSKRFAMRVDPLWLAVIDNWRRHRHPIPSQSAAIQTLANAGRYVLPPIVGVDPIAIFAVTLGEISGNAKVADIRAALARAGLNLVFVGKDEP